MQSDKPKSARILIVEDEPIIAFGLEELLVDAGFEIAAVVHRADKAMACIENGDCVGAIIDANLAGMSAAPIAAALVARGLPFIVLSGYPRAQLQGTFPGTLFLQKPCAPAKLLEVVGAMMTKS